MTSPQSISAPSVGSAQFDLPSRVALVGEGFAGFIDYLLPDARAEFLGVPNEYVSTLLSTAYLPDETADAVNLASRRTSGLARRQFEQAVEQGIESVSDPLPEVTAFFETVDRMPPQIDMAKVEAGARALRRIDPVTLFGAGWTIGFILAAILPNTSSALFRSKRTLNNPGNRLVETGAYVLESYTPGGYERFGPATKTACRLRLMHSNLRMGMVKSGTWDAENIGVPASIGDTIGGALPHTLWTALAAQGAGYRFSDEEMEAIAHFTACAIFRHGAPQEMIPFTPAEQRLFTYASLRVSSAFSDVEATSRLIPAMTSIELPFMPAAMQPIAKGLFNGYTRLIIGDELCDATGVPDSKYRRAITLGGRIIAASEVARRTLPPVAWANEQVANLLWDRWMPRLFKMPEDTHAHLEKLASAA
ncbi:oxygenase MpaB family protein [Nocardia sp. NPDC050406]|uniref:oxygenase MpaB family protein n=1 Tax=Nocardia sp. NPDC050406 TaxID=3364318 RepID=UPI0037B67E6F